LEFTTSALVVLALTAGVSEGIHERRAGIAERVWVKADYSRSARSAVEAWLVPQRDLGACLVNLLLCAVIVISAIAAGGVAAGLVLALLLSFFALVAGSWVGRAVAMRLGAAQPQLRWLARRATAKAEEFRTAGAADQSATALAVAQWIEWLCARAPQLTVETFDAYYTPKQVAGLLVDGDEYEMGVWLKEEATPLWTGPEEYSRVELLERVRRDVLAGGGDITALVDELDRWSPRRDPAP
jgi:hypothetical protein